MINHRRQKIKVDHEETVQLEGRNGRNKTDCCYQAPHQKSMAVRERRCVCVREREIKRERKRERERRERERDREREREREEREREREREREGMPSYLDLC